MPKRNHPAYRSYISAIRAEAARASHLARGEDFRDKMREAGRKGGRPKWDARLTEGNKEASQ